LTRTPRTFRNVARALRTYCRPCDSDVNSLVMFAAEGNHEVRSMIA
jgi:hypothetical protein